MAAFRSIVDAVKTRDQETIYDAIEARKDTLKNRIMKENPKAAT